MKEIRTKPAAGKPKVLDTVTRFPRNAKNAMLNMRDKAKELDTRDVHMTPENYAADKVTGGISNTAKKGSAQTRKRAEQLIRKVRQRTNGTIKTADKSIKTARNTVKTAKRTIKTSERAAKATAKTAKTTAKASTRAARAAARAAVTGVKLLVKATAAAVKAAAAAIKSLVAAIAAGGWIVLVIVIVVGAILFIVNSAFGLFYSNEETGEAGNIPMSQAVAEISGDYSAYVNQQISNVSAGYDNVSVVYDSGIDGDSDSVNNWVDVLGIYAVKTTMDQTEPAEVATVTEEKKQILKNLYYDMNTVSTSAEAVEEVNPDDEAAEPVEKTIVHVNLTSEDYRDAAERYGFTEDQNRMLEELMVPENHYLFVSLIGIDCYGGLTAQELEEIRSGLPYGTGGDIVRAALTRIGDPYSKELRGSGSYVDCSYLVRWAYNQAGVTSYKAATAAEQARYCVDNNMTISKDQLKPGDIIFWRKNGCDCGRYKEIHHVAIYIGNGKIIEASSSRGCVVINDLWGEDSGGKWQVLYYAHPYPDE